MKCSYFVLALVIAGCDGDGAHARCEFGGALTDCPDSERATEAVCWRLVDCGALPVEGEEEDAADWGTCVDLVDGLTADRQRLVTGCVAASSCDELRADNVCFEPAR
jgi:hypothetical protein